jgi:uncharacterized iron-regulated protein
MKKIIAIFVLILLFSTISFSQIAKPSPSSTESTKWEETLKSTSPDKLKNMILDIAKGSFITFDDMINHISKTSIVFVGGTKGNIAHCYAQNTITEALYRNNSKLVLGHEIFQKESQKDIDSYLGNEITEKVLLRKIGYFEYCPVDWRFYKPLIDSVKNKGSKIKAINVPPEILKKVMISGLNSLNEEEKRIAAKSVSTADMKYKDYVLSIYKEGTQFSQTDFKYFYEAQCLWEDTLAKNITQSFDGSKEQMIVLIGNEHIIYKFGAPERLKKNNPGLGYRTIVCISVNNRIPLIKEFDGLPPADYLYFTNDSESSPKPPEIGIKIKTNTDKNKGVIITHLISESPADKAKLLVNDIIAEINSEAITTPADLDLIMFDKKQGDEMELVIVRNKTKEKIKIKL